MGNQGSEARDLPITACAPVVMSRTQFQLLRQLEEEAGPSSPLQQEEMDFAAQLEADLSFSPQPEEDRQDTVRAILLNKRLSSTCLSQEDGAVLADFRRRADANGENTSLTKDYACDVLGEIAQWLYRHSPLPNIRSLTDLQHVGKSGNVQDMRRVWSLIDKFLGSGAAPIQGGNAVRGMYGKACREIVEAWLQADAPMKLPNSGISRREEQLIHTYRTLPEVLGMNGKRLLKPRTIKEDTRYLRKLSYWLNERKANGQPVLYGLDSLEKIRNYDYKLGIVAMLERDYFKAATLSDGEKSTIKKVLLSFWRSMRSPSASAHLVALANQGSHDASELHIPPSAFSAATTAGPSSSLFQEDLDFAAQLEADLFSSSQQEEVQDAVAAILPDAYLSEADRAVIDDFRQRADANSENTSLTKDYACKVLRGIAQLLSRDEFLPGIRSLQDLQQRLNNGNADENKIVFRELLTAFKATDMARIRAGDKGQVRGVATVGVDDGGQVNDAATAGVEDGGQASGAATAHAEDGGQASGAATAHAEDGGQVSRAAPIFAWGWNKTFQFIVQALHQSDKPMQLRSPVFSRQAEALIHQYEALSEVLESNGESALAPQTVKRYKGFLRKLASWLNEKRANGQPVKHGLDSLKKILDCDDDQAIVEMMEEEYFKDIPINDKRQRTSKAAILSFRRIIRSSPAYANLQSNDETEEMPLHAASQQPTQTTQVSSAVSVYAPDAAADLIATTSAQLSPLGQSAAGGATPSFTRQEDVNVATPFEAEQSSPLRQADLQPIPASGLDDHLLVQHLFENTEDELPFAHEVDDSLMRDWTEILDRSMPLAQADAASSLHIQALASTAAAASNFVHEAGPSGTWQEERQQNEFPVVDVAMQEHERSFQQMGNVAAQAEAPEELTPFHQNFLKIFELDSPYVQGEQLTACDNFFKLNRISRYLSLYGLTEEGEKVVGELPQDAQEKVRTAVETRKRVLLERAVREGTLQGKFMQALEPYAAGETLARCEILCNCQTVSKWFYGTGGLKSEGQRRYTMLPEEAQAEVRAAIALRQRKLGKRPVAEPQTEPRSVRQRTEGNLPPQAPAPSVPLTGQTTSQFAFFSMPVLEMAPSGLSHPAAQQSPDIMPERSNLAPLPGSNLSSQSRNVPAGPGTQRGEGFSLRSASQASLTVPQRTLPLQQRLLAQLGRSTSSTQPAEPPSSPTDHQTDS